MRRIISLSVLVYVSTILFSVVDISNGNDHFEHTHHHQHKHDNVKSHQAHQFSLGYGAHVDAIFATAIVGLAPIIILTIIPLGKGSIASQKSTLRIFLSFAAGGLLGDAFLHLIPHSLKTSSSHEHHDRGYRNRGHDYHEHTYNHPFKHSHSHYLDDMMPWLWVIFGILCFMLIEKIVRLHTRDSGHCHTDDSPLKDKVTKKSKTEDNVEKSSLRQRKKNGSPSKSMETAPGAKISTKQNILASGYLNLAADFFHNFTDGLAIGSTFLQGGGWQTMIAILIHEVPHEIGDFAILIRSGFSREKAMKAQVATAVGAMLGTTIGLLVEGAGEEKASWISPFTAGGFIYISCTSIIPELLEEESSLIQTLKEVFGLMTGVGFMVLISMIE